MPESTVDFIAASLFARGLTGGTSGIGRAAVGICARAGAKVVLAGRRAELGRQVANELLAAGTEVRFVQADVSRPEEVERLLSETVAVYDEAVRPPAAGWPITGTSSGTTHRGSATGGRCCSARSSTPTAGRVTCTSRAPAGRRSPAVATAWPWSARCCASTS